MGFIPDIYRILAKYDLLPVLSNFLCTGHFPSKTAWKFALNQHINMLCHRNKQLELAKMIPTTKAEVLFNANTPCAVWELCRVAPSMNPHCQRAICILSKTFSHFPGGIRLLCYVYTDSMYCHEIFHCSMNKPIREQLWQHVLACIGYEQYHTQFITQPETLQLCDILTGLQAFSFQNFELNHCIGACLRLLSKLTNA